MFGHVGAKPFELWNFTVKNSLSFRDFTGWIEVEPDMWS